MIELALRRMARTPGRCRRPCAVARPPLHATCASATFPRQAISASLTLRRCAANDDAPLAQPVLPLYIEWPWEDMLPARARETEMRVPLGMLAGEMGQTSYMVADVIHGGGVWRREVIDGEGLLGEGAGRW